MNQNQVASHHDRLPFSAITGTVRKGALLFALIALFALFGASNASATLLSYWSFDEGAGSTVADGVGTSDLSFHGTPSWVTGVSGSALDFGGSSRVNGAFNEASSLSEVTVAFWFNANAWNNAGVLFDAANNSSFVVQNWVTNQLNLYNPGSSVTSVATPATGEWHHYAFTYSDTSDAAKLYLDGALVDTGSMSGSRTFTNISFGSHGNINPPSYAFNGLIDEAYIYGSALDGSAINDLMNAAESGTTASVPEAGATLLFLGMGLLGLFGVGLRKHLQRHDSL